ncbi:Glucosamine-6-phosphate deaminase 1 [Novipirellula aureliae]|uniref:Glucosamine-6-phosphate deaminase 1 n=1 Tax=Novipirellula aureliae TaxID=2527966 RepID=A0A5C6E3C5_9BACT|nr:6-phosphogluconolactonase [Novipirellula aureliae]TWU43378.1 Glucosamine-6-phosphate deaminase 1 [Novipirellula aureliae]
MRTILAANRQAMGKWIAKHAAETLRQAIEENGKASMVLSSGSAQFEVIAALLRQRKVDWSQVVAFQIGEYVGIKSDDPGSVCRYLHERFANQVSLADFHYIDGKQPVAKSIEQMAGPLENTTIDLALISMGESADLAMNGPPADFQIVDPYISIKLAKTFRKQQVGEGWFPSLGKVPQHAVTMSIQQILKCKTIYCAVPDDRNARAVCRAIEGDIDPEVPASILQWHHGTTIVCDRAAASKLKRKSLDQMERVR